MWYIREAKKPSIQVSKHLFDSDVCDSIMTGNILPPLYINTNEHRYLFQPLFPDDTFSWLYKIIGDCVEELNNATFQFKIESIDIIHYVEMNSNDYSIPDCDMQYQERTARKLSFFIPLNDTDGSSTVHFGAMRKKLDMTPGVISIIPSFCSIEHKPSQNKIRKFLVGTVGGPPFI